MGAIALQPGFAPVARRDIMMALNICARGLGLRPAAVVVLDALLSCLPTQGADGRDQPVTPALLLTVYASNETLCFRARGLSERQLRRHLDTLEAAGLICRRDSANGKRFPILEKGRAIGAFGIDLSPLFARSAELLAAARHQREAQDELRGLRARILQLRHACGGLDLDAGLTAFVEGLRNLLRRSSLTLTEARATLAQLTAIVAAAAPAPEVSPAQRPAAPPATPACDGQNVRHKEPESQTQKTTPPRPDWSELTELNAYYPEPHSPQQAAGIAWEFGRMLRLSQDLLTRAMDRLGTWDLLALEDQMARAAATIQNPDAYLGAVLRALPPPRAQRRALGTSS